eukprot:CAMPEP_0179317914 /NCGR_PEP_ID=MMETSP0797-20121207/56566_1 /TAXON_ID=47934 /ORGANISM="Dinophysis acuminata, Strain DAEP01" /LENGTH=208 /DNA_ID=CAMNT_0021028971 /DNA_START=23 /DNA_END=647 /DNA_ORIENTATION=+
MIRERTARGSQVPREEVRWRAFRLGDGASLGGPAAVVAVPAEDTLVHGELAELEAVYLSQVLDVVDAKPREVLGDEAVVLAAALAAAFEDAPLRALHVDATGEAARVALLARRAVGQLDAVQASLCRRHELVVEEPVPHLVVDALGDDPELLCVAEEFGPTYLLIVAAATLGITTCRCWGPGWWAASCGKSSAVNSAFVTAAAARIEP